MGKGGDGAATPERHSGGAHTDSFAVKNTFIEVDGDFYDDDQFETACKGIVCKRQMSAPVFSLARRVPEQQEPETEKEPWPTQLAPSAPVFSPALLGGDHGYGDAAAVWLPQPLAWSQSFGGHECMLMGFPMELARGWAGAGEAYDPALMGGYFADAQAACETAPAPAVPVPAAGGAANASRAAAAARPEEWTGVTTVMMRNLPNRYTQQMLVEDVTAAAFSGSFDFLYLPIDPETAANKGYAFINFVDNDAAWRFRSAFEGARMPRFNSGKFVSVSPAVLQGFDANHAHYSTARCSRGDPALRPIFLREPSSARGGLRQRGARRAGQRNRGNGRSLVDVAAQAELTRRAQPQAAADAPPPAPAALSAEAAPAVAQFCAFCGGRVQPNFRFCQFCGAATGRGAPA